MSDSTPPPGDDSIPSDPPRQSEQSDPPERPEPPDGSDRSHRIERREPPDLLRPPGLLVFAVFVALVGVVWWLFADTFVERSVEATGASLVGARVDLESADLRLAEGLVSLRGLQVANPQAPMTNLFEAEEILGDLVLEPLLEKKVILQRLRVTGVRFNTPREESGELEDPDPQAGALWREIDEWADQIEVPSLSLEGLGGVVRTDAIDPDSLRTIQYARRTASRADSLRRSWEARLEGLDPRPRIDSVEAVLERLEDFRLSPLSATRLPGLLREGRGTLDRLTDLEDEVAALDDEVRDGVASLDVGPETLGELRSADLAYARGLLDIPSLEGPEISPAIFGNSALTWLKPVLYWASLAERYLPPGLDPRRRPGPERTRAPGTTFQFPEGAELPSFLLEDGELGLTIGGAGAAAGVYDARIRNLTSAPALLGRPVEISAGREEAAAGPSGLRLSAILDHTGDAVRDSVTLDLEGIDLPSVGLGDLGGRLDLGRGRSEFEVRRFGDRIDARLHWVSSDIEWTRTGGEESADVPSATATEIGSAAWAQDLLWRTLAGVQRVELDMGLSGDIASPSLSVSSNVGEAVAASLRRELGQEIEAAEARVREEIDRQVQPRVREARERVAAVESGIADRVGARREEIEALRERLEERIRELGGGL